MHIIAIGSWAHKESHRRENYNSIVGLKKDREKNHNSGSIIALALQPNRREQDAQRSSDDWDKTPARRGKAEWLVGTGQC
jgi:hypothetical protein